MNAQFVALNLLRLIDNIIAGNNDMDIIFQNVWKLMLWSMFTKNNQQEQSL